MGGKFDTGSARNQKGPISYQKTADGWRFSNGGSNDFSAKTIAVFYEVGNEASKNGKPAKPWASMHKHGPADLVRQQYETHKLVMTRAGCDVCGLRIIDATFASEEDLNHILETSLLPPSHFDRLNPEALKATKKTLAGPEIEM